MIAIVSEPSEEMFSLRKREREKERENGRCEKKLKSACLSPDQF